VLRLVQKGVFTAVEAKASLAFLVGKSLAASEVREGEGRLLQVGLQGGLLLELCCCCHLLTHVAAARDEVELHAAHVPLEVGTVLLVDLT